MEALDKRRDLGHTFLVIAGQFTLPWPSCCSVGLVRSRLIRRGWAHPMPYYFLLALILIVFFSITGLILRRGPPRID